MCNTVSDCTKVTSSKVFSNLVTKPLRNFLCVRKFVSASMFAQSVCYLSYRIVKSCEFNLVNMLTVDTRRSVSVCRKVCKTILARVSANVYHVSPADVVNKCHNCSTISTL